VLLARKLNSIEEIPLLRGGDVVSTLTGAFGHSLRETRLTAMLGYLIALCPEPFLTLFRFRGVPQSVSLETRHDLGRSDILIETNAGTGVIEAKVDITDPLVQSRRYKADWVALLTNRLPSKSSSGACYVSWHKIGQLLEDLKRSGSPKVRFFCEDLLKYMQVHHMVKKRSSVEIYAREINEPVTLELFLKAQLYGCYYERTSPVGEALYFAPHFGKALSKAHPGITPV